MTLRKVLFWCHLAAGVTAGVVILIMSVTGGLLMYERQIIAWADTRAYKVAPPSAGASRLSIEAIVARLSEAEPRPAITTVTVRADPGAPVSFAAGPRTLFVDPYTARVMGEGAPGVRRFFRVVTDWHRVLAFSGDRRPIGRAITGACNLAFLFIIASGIFIWWPRIRTRRHLRSITMFNGSLKGKARDFNWHNVIGFWSAIPLFVIVLGSAIISYPWASDLVYRLVGEAPPARQRPEAAPGNASAGGGSGAGRRSPRAPAAGIDPLLARAEHQVAGWRTISFRLPAAAEAPVVFTIDRGMGGEPHKRGTLTLKRPAAEIVKWEPFESLSQGRRLRTWLRFAHTGEVYGLVGQTIAGLLSFGGAVLMYTGLALAFRRFLAWRLRVRSARRAEVAADVTPHLTGQGLPARE
jgi:uncharacterized iron-regulated membrane protein